MKDKIFEWFYVLFVVGLVVLINIALGDTIVISNIIIIFILTKRIAKQFNKIKNLKKEVKK